MTYAVNFLHLWATACVHEFGVMLPVNYLEYDQINDCFFVGYSVPESLSEPLHTKSGAVREFVVALPRLELSYNA
jgi:hypothetical protein